MYQTKVISSGMYNNIAMQGSRLTSNIDHHGGGVDSIGIVGGHSHSVDSATGVHFGLHLHIKVFLTYNNRATVTKVPDVVRSKGLHQRKKMQPRSTPSLYVDPYVNTLTFVGKCIYMWYVKREEVS